MIEAAPAALAKPACGVEVGECKYDVVARWMLCMGTQRVLCACVRACAWR